MSIPLILTCSYAINLSADSGAIFKTLIKFPLHSDFTPPSFNIYCKPFTTPKFAFLLP